MPHHPPASIPPSPPAAARTIRPPLADAPRGRESARHQSSHRRSPPSSRDHPPCQIGTAPRSESSTASVLPPSFYFTLCASAPLWFNIFSPFLSAACRRP